MKLTMDAGLANGLSLGAEFSVYPRKDIKSQPLGNLRLEELQAFSSTVTFTTKEPTFALTQTAFAVQSKPGVKEALRLYLNPPNDKALLRLLFQGGTEESLLKHVRLIDSAPEDAHITISMEKHKVVMADPSLARFGKRTQIATLAPNTHEVARTLRSLSHYFWNLERGDNVSQLVNSLQFEFFKLEKSADMDLQFAPVGPSLYQNNVVELLVNEDDLYGIRLTNKTGRDIFPNLFYFDNSDFGIGASFIFHAVVSFAKYIYCFRIILYYLACRRKINSRGSLEKGWVAHSGIWLRGVRPVVVLPQTRRNFRRWLFETVCFHGAN